ncbi:MAG: AMP-binding protein, partial [Pseudomonadales bacterium]|nr:AMP-binding protein [Pseudomonadales bacterium]
MGWNYGDIYEAVADVMPEGTPALIHKGRVITWQEFERRANNLARNFLDAPGIEYGDKVAFYLRNHSAYMETLFACFKARLTHVNLNYRYIEDELWYILDNSDSKIVVFDAEFRQYIPGLQKRLPDVVLWVQVNEEDDLVDNAVSFEAMTAGDGKRLDIERSGEDMLFLYTGGTTGMPKGVMWEHQNHWHAGAAGATPETNMVPPADVAEHAENVRKAGGGRRSFPVCPQMHGTGLFTCIGSLAQGGCIVTTDSARFDPVETWQIVQDYRGMSMAIVGDAFARPLLKALDEAPGRFDISSVFVIISSGVMWSPEVKEGLLKHNPNMMLIDSFGASE